ADFIPGHEQALEHILRSYDWDYVIGSVHFMGEWGFDDSRYLAEFERRDVDALYRQYFALVAASAETGLFDTIGHSDLIKKFGHPESVRYERRQTKKNPLSPVQEERETRRV